MEKILIIYRASDFQSPCLLSSYSFWRALSRSAAWSDPAEQGFPASPRAAGIPRRRHRLLPLPAGTPPGRPPPAPTSGPAASAAASASASNSLPNVGSPLPPWPSSGHGDALLSHRSPPPSLDILPVTYDLRRRRKCDGAGSVGEGAGLAVRVCVCCHSVCVCLS